MTRAILLLLLLGAAVLSSACGPDGGAYVDTNEAIVEELPLFPGAVELSRESMSYSFEDGGPLDAAEGYNTYVTFHAPGGTTEDDLFDFYMTFATESGWTVQIEEIPVVLLDGRVPQPGVTVEPTPTVYGEPMRHLALCRGESRVQFETVNVEVDRAFDLGGTFAMSVDHSYAQPGGRTAC